MAVTKRLTERGWLLAAYERAVRAYGKAVRVLAKEHGDGFIRASLEANRLGEVAKNLRLRIEALNPKGLDVAAAPLRGGGPNPSRRARLEREERDGLEKLRVAQRNFQEMVTDIPGGLLQPDGILRIQKAGSEVRALRDKHARAAKRLLDCLAGGTIPKDNPDADCS